MSKKKKKESHEVELEHITDDAVQLSESWIEPEQKREQKIESDFEKHPKFAKFKGEK